MLHETIPERGFFYGIMRNELSQHTENQTRIIPYRDIASRLKGVENNIKAPFKAVENWRWDATNVLPDALFTYPKVEKSYEQTIEGRAPLVAKTIAESLVQSREPLQLLIVQFGLVDAFSKAAIRIGRVRPDLKASAAFWCNQIAIRTLQEMQLGDNRSAFLHSQKTQITDMFADEIQKIEQSVPTPIASTDSEFMNLNTTEDFEDRVFDKIEQKLDPKRDRDFLTIRRAVIFANKKHKDQIHLGLQPYMVHIYRVMARLLEDPILAQNKTKMKNALITAALHDILEDTDTAPEEIERMFGSEIKNSVLALSKWINVTGVVEEWNALTYYTHLANQPDYVRYVKGYDRVDNWHASHKKVHSEIEDKKIAIKAQEAYREETSSYFYPLVSDNPVLMNKLQEAIGEGREALAF